MINTLRPDPAGQVRQVGPTSLADEQEQVIVHFTPDWRIDSVSVARGWQDAISPLQLGEVLTAIVTSVQDAPEALDLASVLATGPESSTTVHRRNRILREMAARRRQARDSRGATTLTSPRSEATAHVVAGALSSVEVDAEWAAAAMVQRVNDLLTELLADQPAVAAGDNLSDGWRALQELTTTGGPTHV